MFCRREERILRSRSDGMCLSFSPSHFAFSILTATALALCPLKNPLPAFAAMDRLEFPPLREVRQPTYSKHKLSNGLVVYLMEDHEVPLVGGTLTFRGGNRVEPDNRHGLGAITASVLRSGGSQGAGGQELDDFLASRAAYLGASSDGSSFNVAFTCLKEDVDAVFPKFVDLVKQPAFPADKLALAKRQAIGAIARRNDNPNDIVQREIRKLVYGTDSVYARTVEYEGIAPITADNLYEFYTRQALPNNATLSLIGDFSTKEMLKEIRTFFDADQWPAFESLDARLSTVVPVDPQAAEKNRGVVFLADKPELSQSYVRVAELGGLLRDPDYVALDVVNQLLNGLGGRLFNEIRSKSGLAYSVFGTWYAAFDHSGMFVAGGETSSGDGTQLVSFMNKLTDVLKQLDRAEVSDEELQYAKDSTLNSFVFNFTSADEILARTVKYAFYDYPEDFADRYRRGIEKVSKEDVMKASRDRIREEDLIYLVVGNAKGVEPALKKAGFTVRYLDITIPPMKELK